MTRCLARAVSLFALLVATTGACLAASPLLLRNPSLSKERVAFLYADDIWTAPRDGGEAQRLTSEGSIVAGP